LIGKYVGETKFSVVYNAVKTAENGGYAVELSSDKVSLDILFRIVFISKII